MYRSRSLVSLPTLALFLAACSGSPTRQAPAGMDIDALELGAAKSAPRGSLHADRLALTPKKANEIRVHVLPVGGGMCHVVECPGAGAPDPMLLDCGASTGSQGHGDLTKDGAVSDVRKLVNGRPTIVVLSHSDSDHSNYVPDIFPNAADVRSIWMGSNFWRFPAATQYWANRLQVAGVPVYKDFAPDSHGGGRAVAGLACGTANTFILTVNAAKDANGGSLMLSIDHGDTHMIFPGDATGAAQDSAMANYPGDLLRSEIVEASHHGATSNGSNAQNWAGATMPRYLITSAGTSYYHPRCDAVASYVKAGRLYGAPEHNFTCGNSGGWSPTNKTEEAIFNTEESGTIVITANTDPASTVISCDGSRCNY